MLVSHGTRGAQGGGADGGGEGEGGSGEGGGDAGGGQSCSTVKLVSSNASLWQLPQLPVQEAPGQEP